LFSLLKSCHLNPLKQSSFLLSSKIKSNASEALVAVLLMKNPSSHLLTRSIFKSSIAAFTLPFLAIHSALIR
jgi:hypothetical protein